MKMSHRIVSTLLIISGLLLAACAGSPGAPPGEPAPLAPATGQASPGAPSAAVVTAPPTRAGPTPPTVPAGPLTGDAPRLFFTDLESGPNLGGENNLGVFITLYGEGFGARRGNSTVTLGGREVANYVIWGQDNAMARKLDMLVVQPGPNVPSGNLVVTVNGKASNPLPFTVRSGQIFFVMPQAPGANDANPGTFERPFKTIYRPREVMQPGDIVYLKGGSFTAADPGNPGWDAILLLTPDAGPNGTADRPVAYIGYPGARPVIGSPTLRRGIMFDEATAYYIIANLELTQLAGNLEVSGSGHRIIGNYSHDGINAEGQVIGVTGNSAHLQIWGNFMRDNGGTGDEAGHGFYVQGFGTNQDIDFGWNEIRDHRGKRAIQLFGHADGDRMDNIRIHDNLITGSVRNNILLGGSDGSTDVLGTIYVYNNIVAGADDQGLRINDPQGTVYVQNNVFYNNGSHGFDGNAQIYIERAGAGRITLQNNILYAESGQTYFQFEKGVDPSVFAAASNNLVYNAGVCPAWAAACLNADPLFMNLAALDFRLKAGSPAIDAGIDARIPFDHDHVSRPQGRGYDLGAFER